jgi:hypothetical protein
MGCLKRGFESCNLRSQPPDLVDRIGGEGVALDLQALQVLRQPNLEPLDFHVQVGVFEEPLAVRRVDGGDRGF